MKYYQVEVFSQQPFSGTGLTIFTDTEDLGKAMMQTIKQEM
jgi:predicted PhzF superfamily epimerase YddE/YHI9